MSLANHIDHTILKADTTLAEVEKLCKEAISNNFAAVCVPPIFIKQAKELTAGSGVKTATVIGFPFGYSAIEAKLAETVLAMVAGADELDMVINIAALKNDDWQYLAKEITTILPVIKSKEKTLKVIIESGILTDEEISKCCGLYGAAGVDYMKTSTGYASAGASVHAVRLMRENLPNSVLIKASGGIKTRKFAEELIAAGADRLGCSSSVAIVNEKND